MSLLKAIRAHYKFGGLDPNDLDRYEPLPYLRRQIEKQWDALMSGILIGIFFFAFLMTLFSNYALTTMKHIGHGIGMVSMLMSLALYLLINMHRFRWLPIALVGIVLLLLGEFG
jgi:hypothetical protein